MSENGRHPLWEPESTHIHAAGVNICTRSLLCWVMSCTVNYISLFRTGRFALSLQPWAALHVNAGCMSTPWKSILPPAPSGDTSNTTTVSQKPRLITSWLLFREVWPVNNLQAKITDSWCLPLLVFFYFFLFWKVRNLKLGNLSLHEWTWAESRTVNPHSNTFQSPSHLHYLGNNTIRSPGVVGRPSWGEKDKSSFHYSRERKD